MCVLTMGKRIGVPPTNMLVGEVWEWGTSRGIYVAVVLVGRLVGLVGTSSTIHPNS